MNTKKIAPEPRTKRVSSDISLHSPASVMVLPVMKILAIAVVLVLAAGCGGDDGPKSPEETVCRRIETCDNLVAYKTHDQCVKDLGDVFAQQTKACGDCASGLTCDGLGKMLSDPTAGPSLCSDCK